MPRSAPDEYADYRPGDITYCVDPANDVTYQFDPGIDNFFPVRVVKIGRQFLEMESLHPEQTKCVAADFDAEAMNRRFTLPKLPAVARFGGCDERPVNAERISGPELRLLTSYYNTFTNGKIKVRNKENPERWPLPTGVVYERWFKEITG